MLLKTRPGLFFAFMAPLGFSLMNVLAKYSSSDLPSIEVVFFRSLFSLLILFTIMMYKKESFKGQQNRLLIMRGIFGGVGLIGVFYTIAHLKLADASILLQLNPIFVALFALIFLKESPPRFFLGLLFSSLIGAFLLIRPSFETGLSIPALVGVGAAISAAAAYTCVRQLTKSNSTNIIIFYYMLIALLISFPGTFRYFVFPTPLEWFALIGIGLTSSIAQICLTKAYQFEKASIVALISYTGIVLHACWGYLFWSERLDLTSIVGGLFIIIPCMLLVVRKKK